MELEYKSLDALREELEELRILHRRGWFRRLTVLGGYAAIALGGGLLFAWALGAQMVWLAVMLGIAMFALLMAWPTALQRQLDMIFFGRRPRLDLGYVKRASTHRVRTHDAPADGCLTCP